MKKLMLSILILSGLSAIPAFGQSFRSLNNDGVDLYKEKKYGDAEINFRKGIEKEPGKFKGYFNLGDNYYKLGKFDEAIKSYKSALGKTTSGTEKADAYHNIGNALLKKGQYQESIDAFKNSLKLNPKDKETKYNLSYALNMLKNEQNKNQNNKDKNKDKNQDKNKDKQNQDQNKNDQNKNNDKNKNDQNKNDENKNDQQKQPQQAPPKVKKEEAERMLEALKNNEQDLQKKLRKKAVVKVKTDKDW